MFSYGVARHCCASVVLTGTSTRGRLRNKQTVWPLLLNQSVDTVEFKSLAALYLLHSELYEAVNTVSEYLEIQRTICIIKFGLRFIWTSAAKPDPFFWVDPDFGPKIWVKSGRIGP